MKRRKAGDGNCHLTPNWTESISCWRFVQMFSHFRGAPTTRDKVQRTRSGPLRVGSQKNRLNYVSKCSGSKTFSCCLALLVVFYVFLHSFLCLPLSPSSSLISLSFSSLNLSRVSHVKWKLARATCRILSKYFTAAFNPI